jgi:hypothetical protein
MRRVPRARRPTRQEMAVNERGCVGPFREDFESHSADVTAARADGAFTTGWLPNVVPDDAQDIWEVHNIASNLTWGCFSTPSGHAKLKTTLETLHASRVSGPMSPGPNGWFGTRPWWPKAMQTSPIEVYKFNEEARVVAVGLDQTGAAACFHLGS